MLNKTTIAANFSKSAPNYDHFAQAQKFCAKSLVNFALKFIPDYMFKSYINISDVGCGTGFVTEELIHHFFKANYTLIDISDEMLKVAKSKIHEKSLYSNFEYVLSDAEKVHIHNQDIVISNLCLQWFEDIEKFMSRILDKNTFFCFSVILPSTFKKFHDIYGQFFEKNIENIGYSIEKFNSFCKREKVIFSKTSEIKIPLTFCNLLEFLRYIKGLGASVTENKSQYCQLKKMCDNYNTVFHTEYDCLIVVMKKEK